MMETLLTNPKLTQRLPTQADILGFYDDLKTYGVAKDDAINGLSAEVVKTWAKADCPPLRIRLVKDKIKALLISSQEARRKPRETHQAKKAKTGVPTRRSLRQQPENVGKETEDNTCHQQTDSNMAISPGPSQPQEQPVRPSSRTRSSVSTERQWMEGFDVLFDILSQQKVDSGEHEFDEDFYIDQKGPRKLWIAKKLNPEFQHHSEQQQKTESNRERRRRLASGEATFAPNPTLPDDVSSEEEPQDHEFDEVDLSEFMEASMTCSTPEVLDRPNTRNSSRLSSSRPLLPSHNAATQTEAVELDKVNFPAISIRKAARRAGKEAVLIDPKILECIVEVETTARCSLSTAITVTQIVANRIFDQNWQLPLALDKEHLSDVQLMKKMKAKTNQYSNPTDEDVEIDVEAHSVTINDRGEENDVEKVQQRISDRQRNKSNRLPSMTAVRDARHLISMETEKRVAEEMLQNECAIVPDGTGRKVIGKVGGAMLQVGGRTRVLPFQRMGNETRENWAKFIDHILSRMAVVSEKEKKDLWGTVLLFISDQCKTNKGLAKEVAQYMGLEHQPGQIYCNIHPVLMFDEKMKKIWQDLQIRIGAEKIFPSISYSNLDQETTIVIMQCLDALMRLVSPTFSHKAWSRYFQFNKFLGNRKNRAFAVKDRRFGALPASCLVALHHFDDIQAFLDQNPDCRNQLACICRGMADLEDVLKFAWASLALIGIHLYEPYLYLIIDLNTVQSQLIGVFQQLYTELMNASKRKSLCQLKSPALRSLEAGWRSPLSPESPYEQEVVESLQTYLKDADEVLMHHHIDASLKTLAQGFADQKGAAYGFGPNCGHGPSLTQELSLEKLDKFHTHSKSIENAFGHMDNLLRQSGPQGFSKAIQAMQIASAKDLVFDESHSWRHMTMSTRTEMRNLQFDWTESQKKLLDSGVKETDVNALQRAQMMTKLIASLKKHDGPLNSDKEIDSFLERYKSYSEKDQARMLNEEIRFRRDSNLRFSVSKDCYLYRQRGISNELRVKNLRLLVRRPEARSSATIDDLRGVLLPDSTPAPAAAIAEQETVDPKVRNVLNI